MAETGRAAVLACRIAVLPRRWRSLVGGGIGAVAALGQAPVGAWPLTIVALALGFGLFLRSGSWRQAVGLGWALGTGYFLVSLNWIIEPFLVDVARHGWMAPFALLGLAGGLALFWAAGLALGRIMGGGAVGFIGGLGLLELARGYVLTGFPWAQPGHVLIDTPFLHWASYLGSAGLMALVLLAAVALWHGITGARVGLLGVAGLAVLWPIGAGLTPEVAAGPDAAIVRLIQPNAPQNEKWRPDKMREFFDRQVMFSAAGEVRPDLIVWPETAVPVLLENAAQTLEVISEAAGAVPVVVGLQRYDAQRLFNTLALVEAGGRVTAVYDKHHLVPFGEYMPYGDLLADWGIHGMASKDGQGFSPGPGAQVINMGTLGRALPLICYEGVFAQDLRSAPERADFILLITNDAWFGKFSGPYQHLAQARLRSAEFGLPMIRVANTGVSAMIDATGRITEALPLGEAGWRDAALPPALPPTVYARLGDAPMLAVFLVLLGLSRVGHRRARVVR
ncbi:apolipoprotein N-acyltransferase [Roseovarius sp. MBR-51]